MPASVPAVIALVAAAVTAARFRAAARDRAAALIPLRVKDGNRRA